MIAGLPSSAGGVPQWGVFVAETSQTELFVQVVAMFQYAAMQQMGKIANPLSGKIERDLAQARVSIDIVEMLHDRTQGRRSREESEFLDKVLFELRMNYIDEVHRDERSAGGAPGGAPENAPPGDAPDER